MSHDLSFVHSVRIFILMLACCGPDWGWTQPTEPSFKQLTVEDGLSNNWVKAILKDHSGYMWFGTFNGLNRYEGQQVKTFVSNTQNNLSDNFIQALAEDVTGNIWVGTFRGGLNLFDRKKESFTPFYHLPADSNSISSNRVQALLASSDGQLWAGTDRGLDVLNHKTGTFLHFRHSPTDPHSLTSGMISCIFQDRDHRIWVGTENGLNLFLGESRGFKQWIFQKDNLKGLPHPYVSAIYEDKYRNIWVGTWGGGLSKLDQASQTFRHFQHQTLHPNSLSNNAVLSVIGDQENLIFIATEGGGLNIFHIQEETFSAYLPDLNNSRSLNSNSIHALFYGAGDGILWVGSYNGGVNYFSKWDKPYRLYRAKPNGLNDNHVTCIEEDKNGLLWIGTDGGGVNIFKERNQQFSYLNTDEKSGFQLLSNAILALHCDSKNRMWVGSYNGGLDLISSDRRSITHFNHDPDRASSLSENSVNSIYEDKLGNIWVGTMHGGLNLLLPDGRSFRYYGHIQGDSTSIIDNFIYGVLEDSHGRILVQTGKGLEVFDFPSGRFSRFNEKSHVDFDVPVVLHEDSQGNLWIGSMGKGLFRVDRTRERITNYTTQQGLSSNSIAGILEDGSGNLWISTHKGLCKLEDGVNNPEKAAFYVYSVADGLQGSEFKRGAYCLLQNGEMVFAGQNGFNIFDPLKVRNNPFIPPVVITGLKLFNQEVDFHSGNILQVPISEAGSISLSHKQSVITLEFSALNYLLPEKNQFAYMLEGFENEWNYIGNQRNATYTNLDPGDYTFRVKASNNDGIWNETGSELEIHILPPWWELPLVRLAESLLLIGGVITYFRVRTIQFKRSNRILEHKVTLRTADLRIAKEEIEARQKEIVAQNDALHLTNEELAQKSAEIARMAEEIRELNEAKIRFFTNISHELRTPLNLILWTLEDLMEWKSQQPTDEKLSLMHANATRLIRLINQLLDFQKVETGALHLNLEKKEVIGLLHQTFKSFQEWAHKKQIRYEFHSEVQNISACVDEDKIEKILSNILSNAFKFVDEGGTIRLSVAINQEPEAEKSLLLEVMDDGRGISRDHIDRIFERFYSETAPRFPGSGIGLSLVRELTEVYGGEVWVESEEGKGASFFVRLPLVENGGIEPGTPPRDLAADTAVFPVMNGEIPSVEEITTRTRTPKSTLLLVEDNPEILRFMGEKLGLDYQVLFAGNSSTGLNIAQEETPDLIVCDVMMPDMDGYQLCELLKSDERTSHIPILMVTARSGEENTLKGLSHGADDYLAKPFPFDLLRMKIRNILFTRQKLKEQFVKDTRGWAESQPLNPLDEKFLKKAVEVVTDNMQNATFGVETFSESFNMSRRNALRKIRAITGLSINEFIRHTRLMEAHKLLRASEMNVSEVAYSVGFSDPKYFSLCFKKQFGYSPSELKTPTE